MVKKFLDKNGIGEIEVTNTEIMGDGAGDSFKSAVVKDLTVLNKKGEIHFNGNIKNILILEENINSIQFNGALNKYNNVVIDQFSILNGLSVIKSKKDFIFNATKGRLDGSFDYEIFYEDFSKQRKYLPVYANKSLELSRAEGEFTFNISKKEKSAYGSLKLISENNATSISNVSFKFDYQNSILNVSKLNALGKNGGSVTLDSLDIDVVNQRLVNSSSIKIDDINVNPSEPLVAVPTKASMSGLLGANIKLFSKDNKLSILINELSVEKYCLFSASGVPSLCLGDVLGNITLTNEGEFTLAFDVNLDGSQVFGKGTFSENNINITTDKIAFNSNMIRKLYGLDLISKGELSLKYLRSKNYDKLVVDCDLQNLSVEEFNLGEINALFHYDFNNSSLVIESAKGEIGKSKYQGAGEFLFNEGAFADLDISFKSFNVNDLQMIIPNYLGQAKPIIDSIKSYGRGKVLIKGPLELSDLEIYGHING